MGKIKKPYRVYLFTRPYKPKAANQENGKPTLPISAPAKLRVQVIAKGKSHYAAFPLMVRDFSKRFNSNGTFLDGYSAKGFKDTYESRCVAAAYQAACNAAEWMLRTDHDYWTNTPAFGFSVLANNQYDHICKGFKIPDCYVLRRTKEGGRR